jgi:hypothetical protein
MQRQTLTLQLDGITAGDYLQWVRDPDPPALGAGLRAVDVDAEPLDEEIAVVLDWAVPAPPARRAAPAAGLPLSAGVSVRRAEIPAAPVAARQRPDDAPNACPARAGARRAAERLPAGSALPASAGPRGRPSRRR